MALTLNGLKKLVEGAGLRYFVAPDRPVIMLGAEGLNGRYQFVISLEDEGKFLQFRTISYLHCPGDHPHLPEVLKVLGSVNYRTRLVKLGWDPNDGEIVGYADIWLVDGAITQDQFTRMLHNFIPAIDLSYPRLTQALEAGKDPGEVDPEEMMRRVLGGRGLPGPLRSLLEKLLGKKEPEGKEGKPPDFSSI